MDNSRPEKASFSNPIQSSGYSHGTCPAPGNLLTVIRCKCKTDCKTNRCTCRKHGLDCSMMCTDCRGVSCFNRMKVETVSFTDCGKGCELCDNDENKCNVCKEGFYKLGDVCNLCSKGCRSCQNDDVCYICKDGFGLTHGTCQHCFKGCSQCELIEGRIKCESCFPGYYIDGDICKKCTKDSICSCNGSTFWNGSTCSLCPVGCTRCSSSQSCSECKSGYYGQTCHYPCSKGCNVSACAKFTGSCPCKIGFSGLGCDIQCPEKCKDCLSVYYCSACKHGYYGETCQNTCSLGCIDSICDINNGTCINKVCRAYFVGKSCDKCEQGKYGEHCQNSCPGHCVLCNSDQYCTECNDDFYGEVCERKCPSNCFKGMCTKEGSCSSCIEGYYGHTCEERCPDHCQTCVTNDNCRSCHIGFYGNVCQFNCSCLNWTCDQEDGTCIHGCRNGSDGPTCEFGDKAKDLTAITGLAVTGALVIGLLTLSVCVILGVKRRQQRNTAASDENVVNTSVELNNREYEELLPSQGPVYINLQTGAPQDNQTTHIYDELSTNII